MEGIEEKGEIEIINFVRNNVKISSFVFSTTELFY